MARVGRLGFLGIAVVFHLIYLYSIFDIYFVSPIVSGMQQYSVNAEAPAKRLFLIVGDGLRADKCFQAHEDPDTGEKNKHLAPFIRSKVLNEGTFGVSHTRVPTESRPGHIALIAGLYEDVSAVTTGWKHNPVNFDSVFNESRHTWSWGSPDILPMFSDGASDPYRVDAYTYGHEFEDFTQDATMLDIWVFDHVEAFFKEARNNATLNALLHQDKLVFFLHLLGLDTSGHSYRPYSREYLRSLKVVDEGVARVSNIVNEFYKNDDKTAWVFTADHGMSDWGSHGDGHPDNTRTPLVAWGAGVGGPVKSKPGERMSGHEDGLSSDWNLEHVRRVDVAQADVAALMAYLVGINFPVNSVGELPLEYLDAGNDVKAEAAYTNARQILEQYKVKEDHKKATALRYTPYEPLGDGSHSLESRSAEIRALIDGGFHELAIQRCLELIQDGLGGLRYLQTYDWLFLRTIVTVGYLGWIAYALVTVINSHVLHGQEAPIRNWTSFSFFSSILVALFSVLLVQRSSWTYYAYAFFPVFFWEGVFARRNSLSKGCGELFAHLHSVGSYVGLVVKTLGFFAVLETMVWGYNHREIFSVCFLLATTWPFFYGTTFLKQDWGTALLWAACCIVMSSFTQLPVVKVEDERLILLGGALMFLFGLSYMIFGNSMIDPSARGLAVDKDAVSQSILGIQVGLIALAMVVTQSSIRSLQAKQGLPLGNQAVGWLVLALSLTAPFLHAIRPQSHYCHRLMVIFLTFSPTFIILTISYEGLFYVAFCLTLVTWVRLEHKIYMHSLTPAPTSHHLTTTKKQHIPSTPSPPKPPTTATETSKLRNPPGQYRTLTLSSFRISLFFFFLIQSAFFSTGNIASISSFSLDSVYRLIPIFAPFPMTALLLFKILIPFILISANLAVLNRKLHLQPSGLFLVVMALSDVLTLNFFWLVRDEGSWLEIGSTISHYCIGGGLFVFVAGLELVSERLVGGVRFEEELGGGKEGEKVAGPEKAQTRSGMLSSSSSSSSSQILMPGPPSPVTTTTWKT